MISKLDYLLELKKLKSLNELVIEDNPVLVLKESADILRCLPIKVKQKESREQKNKPTSPPAVASHTSSAGGSLINKNLQGTPGQANNSNANYYSNSLLKSNYSMNVDLNNINPNSSGTFNSNISNILNNNNLTNSILINNGSSNSTSGMCQTNKSTTVNPGICLKGLITR
jgi:hypothetical protein